MGGYDDNVATIGDWMPPSPSPRSFFSAILNDDVSYRSASEPKEESKDGFVFPGTEGQFGSGKGGGTDGSLGSFGLNQAAKPGPFSEQPMSSRSGLVERMAARSGFSAPRLYTESIKTADITQSSAGRSPYLTIPPGLSPTTLLDSPVFLMNSLVQPSPTTGKFQFSTNDDGKSSMGISAASDKSKDKLFDNNTSPFEFKPVAESAHLSRNSVTPSFLVRQTFPNNTEVSVQSENPFPPQSVEPSKIHSRNESALHLGADFSQASADKNDNTNVSLENNRSFNALSANSDLSPPLNDMQDDDADGRVDGDGNLNNAPSEDGFNWRKYGQKQVKGSEFPRSYYKCTHSNCPVKKKVERSLEGHITEIIYKGAHNHPKPAPNRRSLIGSSSGVCDMPADVSEQVGIGADGSNSVWTTMQKGPGEWRNDNLEVTSSAQLGTLQAQNGSQFESSEAVDGSSTFSNEEEEEDDRGTHCSVSLGCDGDGEESESKRRKVEAYAADMSGANRAIREPRVVVQTTSEVDILDDGYRWRKYGQKVVKGNPNPRSYYKCTNPGCTVRKHVERASHDLKSVITTYEGKHSHDVPAARNTSHISTGVSNTMPSQAQSVQTQILQPEPSLLQNGLSRFERPLPVGSFGQQLGASHGFGFGMNQPNLANLTMAGFGPNQAKMPVLSARGYFGQPSQTNDMGLVLPKGEPKVEPGSDPGLNLQATSSFYDQLMNRLPLGPHM